MSRIAFLGTGAMGSRMAANLIAAGHELVVYNRTAERLAALVARGARPAASPRGAVADADSVIAMVTDDDAAQAVWLESATGALAAMRPGTVAMECSTLSAGFVDELASRCAEHAVPFLAAPVVGSLPQAEAKALVVLAGGDSAVLEQAHPILAATAARIVHCGTPLQAAMLKLAANAMFSIQVAAFAELTGFLEKADLKIDRVLSALGDLPVMSPAMAAAAALMTKRDHTPRYPIRLVDKDLEYLLKAAVADHAELPVVEAARQDFSRALLGGLGECNIAAIVRLFAS